MEIEEIEKQRYTLVRKLCINVLVHVDIFYTSDNIASRFCLDSSIILATHF